MIWIILIAITFFLPLIKGEKIIRQQDTYNANLSQTNFLKSRKTKNRRIVSTEKYSLFVFLGEWTITNWSKIIKYIDNKIVKITIIYESRCWNCKSEIRASKARNFLIEKLSNRWLGNIKCSEHDCNYFLCNDCNKCLCDSPIYKNNKKRPIKEKKWVKNKDTVSRSAEQKSKATSKKESQKNYSNLNKQEQILFENLKVWRLLKAKEEKLSPAYVFHDKNLINIVILKPKTKDDLLDISGIGPSKFGKYGDEILAIVNK